MIPFSYLDWWRGSSWRLNFFLFDDSWCGLIELQGIWIDLGKWHSLADLQISALAIHGVLFVGETLIFESESGDDELVEVVLLVFATVKVTIFAHVRLWLPARTWSFAVTSWIRWVRIPKCLLCTVTLLLYRLVLEAHVVTACFLMSRQLKIFKVLFDTNLSAHRIKWWVVVEFVQCVKLQRWDLASYRSWYHMLRQHRSVGIYGSAQGWCTKPWLEEMHRFLLEWTYRSINAG